MAIRISAEIREAMLGQMIERYPLEGCGLILGRWQGDEAQGTRYIPCENRHAGRQERRFIIDPDIWQRVEDEADAEHLSIVSIVHSHPDHPDQPSEFDRLHAWPGLSYIIIAVRQGRIAGFRSWRLREDRSAFDAEVINE